MNENSSQMGFNSDSISLALGCLIDDVAEIKSKVDHLMQHLGMGAAGLKPVTVVEAAKFLSLSERQVRKMVKERSIPYYERNGKIYFFEKELMEWIKGSRVATFEEELNNIGRNRYKRR